MNLKRNQSGLSQLQQLIIDQCKRLSYGQQTVMYETQEIPFEDIPQNVSKQIRANHSKCIFLKNGSNFQTITFAVMEYIYSAIPSQHGRLINLIRVSVCKQQFMFGSGYIKGMIIKGLKKMNQNYVQRVKPIANYLQESDSMAAFTQFWKQIIEQQSQGEIQSFSNEPEPSYFQYISNYLEIGFILHFQHPQGIRSIKVRPVSKTKSCEFCTILIKNRLSFTKSNQNKPTANNETPQYIILISNFKNSDNSFKLDLINIQSSDSQELKTLKIKAWQVKQKGIQLVRQFKQFIGQLQCDR